MIATCSEHGMSAPLNYRDVVSSVFEMQKNEVTIPQLNSMSLAFQLDTKSTEKVILLNICILGNLIFLQQKKGYLCFALD